MLGFRRNTLLFKTTLIYIVVTMLNVTLFVVMVFENQMDLIMDNVVLNSERKGINFKSSVDKILKGKKKIDKKVLKSILKNSKYFRIKDIVVFKENGKILIEMKNNVLSKRNKGTEDELRWINRAITRKTFENSIFTHDIIRDKKTIRLYVPVSYGNDKTIILSPFIRMADIDNLMKGLYRQCVVIGMFLVLIHMVMGIFFTRLILRPISNLNDITAKIAEGNLQVRAEIVREDEIGQLAISFNEMTVALARMQEEAKGANPLTGLPGNILIEKEIEGRIKSGKLFAVLYCDLDNFKAYNDKYGFNKGDEIILHTKASLLEAVKRKGKNQAFVGHEGGDDFVIVTSFEVWEDVAKYAIAAFDREVPSYYKKIDAENGYIESVSRQGIPMKFPLVSISIAVVTNQIRKYEQYAQVVSVAAEMKKLVKSKNGSCYAVDRRKDPPAEGYEIKPLFSGSKSSDNNSNELESLPISKEESA